MSRNIDRDLKRFRQIVRGRVRKNLKRYVTHGEMIGRKGRETVSIPELVAEPLRNSLGWAQRQIYDAGLKTRVYGRANIPQNRPTIVVSNHCSHLDMGLVKFALGPYGRKLVRQLPPPSRGSEWCGVATAQGCGTSSPLRWELSIRTNHRSGLERKARRFCADHSLQATSELFCEVLHRDMEKLADVEY